MRRPHLAKPVLIALGLLACLFTAIGVLGVVTLRAAGRAAGDQVRSENAGLVEALRLEREAHERNIIPVSDCLPADVWSAYPERVLTEERVYAFRCAGKTYLMMPGKDPR